jgi:hypothetical protein
MRFVLWIILAILGSILAIMLALAAISPFIDGPFQVDEKATPEERQKASEAAVRRNMGQ